MWFAIIFTVVLLFVLYRAARRAGLGRITYKRYFSQSGVFEGDSVTLIEEIENPTPLPLFMVDVSAYLSSELRLEGCPQNDSGMQEFVSRFYLPPFTRTRRFITINCKRRGCFRLETVSIHGLSRPAAAAIHVYPRILPFTADNPMANEMQYMALSVRRLLQDPFNFAGVRDYRHGDPMGSINYKATAKTGAVKVNEYDFFSGRNIMLYVDFHPPAEGLPHYNRLMEQALSYGAGIVESAVQQGYNVGFAANCHTLERVNHVRFPMRKGYEHYMDILQGMAVLRIAGGCSLLWLMRQDLDSLWNADIYIMTTNRNYELDEITDIFHTRSNHVTLFMLDEE